MIDKDSLKPDEALKLLKKKFSEDLIEKSNFDPFSIFSEYMQKLEEFQKAIKIFPKEQIEKAIQEAEQLMKEQLAKTPSNNDTVNFLANQTLLLDYINVLKVEALIDKALKDDPNDEEAALNKIINTIPEHLRPYIDKDKRDNIREHIQQIDYDFFSKLSSPMINRLMICYQNIANHSRPIIEENLKSWIGEQLKELKNSIPLKNSKQLESLLHEFKGMQKGILMNPNEPPDTEKYVEKIQLKTKQNLYMPYRIEIDDITEKIRKAIEHKKQLKAKLKGAMHVARFTVSKKGMGIKAKSITASQVVVPQQRQPKEVSKPKSEERLQQSEDLLQKVSKRIEQYYLKYFTPPYNAIASHESLHRNLNQYGNLKQFLSAEEYLFKKMEDYAKNNASDAMNDFIENILKKEAIQYIIDKGFTDRDPLIRITQNDLEQQNLRHQAALASFNEFLNLPQIKNPKDGPEREFKNFLLKQILNGNDGVSMSSYQIQNVVHFLKNPETLHFFETLFKRTQAYQASSGWHHKFSKESIQCAPILIFEFLNCKNTEELTQKAHHFAHFHIDNPSNFMEKIKNKASDFKKCVNNALKQIKIEKQAAQRPS